MKAEIIYKIVEPPPPPIGKVTITMSIEEARFLHRLIAELSDDEAESIATERGPLSFTYNLWKVLENINL